MVGHSLQWALEHEVVGQPRAIQALARAVTITRSGLANPERPAGIYLFVGPSGTGKTHLARTLARQLHGDARHLAVVDCGQLAGRSEWPALIWQLLAHFCHPAPGSGGNLLAMAPLSIVLLERPEQARPEFVPTLVAAVEAGYLPLPDGRYGSLRGCLVLLTSSLCAREIHEAGRQEIGFSRAADLEDSTKARIYQQCTTAVEKLWGADFLNHLDDLIVFHRLSEAHLPLILRRLVGELNRRLAGARITCDLAPAAANFLLARGSRFLRQGAWVLVKSFRRFVVAPIAERINAGALPAGSRVLVGLDGDTRLSLAVAPAWPALPGTPVSVTGLAPVELPIAWEA